MNGSRLCLLLASALGFSLCCGLPRGGFAQEPAKWQVPDRIQQLDFSGQNSRRRVLFTEDGLAYEVGVNFLLLGHRHVVLEAQAEDPGRLEAELPDSDGLLHVQPVSGRQDRLQLALRLPEGEYPEARKQARARMDQVRETAHKQARQDLAGQSDEDLRKYLAARDDSAGGAGKSLREAYLQARTWQLMADQLRQDTATRVRDNPLAMAVQEEEALSQSSDKRVVELYQQWLDELYETAAALMVHCELEVRPGARNAEQLQQDRLHAIAWVLSGTPEQRDQVRQIGSEGMVRLRQTLTATLRCRFLPAADPRDANAQWFNGQRVSCLARGVASIRVQGQLDPAQHDRVDWWTLVGYHRDKVRATFADEPGVRYELLYDEQRQARLRVVATGNQPVAYWIEFRPTSAARGDQKVIIHETPSMAETTFPF